MAKNNVKKQKIPTVFKIFRWLFPKLERIAPRRAERLFTHLFFTPHRYRLPDQEIRLIKEAKEEVIRYNDLAIKVYQWGEGIPVLFVHGWMGRAGQFAALIKELSKNGYKCIAFDGPAHGYSEGTTTNLLEFSDIIQVINTMHGNFELVIGHSLGGIATIHSLIQNRFTSKIVTISSPSLADDILEEFRKRLNASKNNINYLLDYVKKEVNLEFKELSGSYLIQQLDKEIELLAFHDFNDSQVSLKHAEALVDNYSNSHLIMTKGNGHNRILKDRSVVKDILDFLNKKTIHINSTSKKKEVIEE